MTTSGTTPKSGTTSLGQELIQKTVVPEVVPEVVNKENGYMSTKAIHLGQLGQLFL